MRLQLGVDFASVNAHHARALSMGVSSAGSGLGGERDKLKGYVRRTIPGPFRKVEVIAKSILFLATDQSSFVTGHCLVVDGGECI